MPKKAKRYCRKCRAHTEHSLKEYKGGKARSLAAGTRKHERNTSGYMGKYQAIAQKKKLNKKPTFIATCSACNSKHQFTFSKRMKKVQLS